MNAEIRQDLRAKAGLPFTMGFFSLPMQYLDSNPAIWLLILYVTLREVVQGQGLIAVDHR